MQFKTNKKSKVNLSTSPDSQYLAPVTDVGLPSPPANSSLNEVIIQSSCIDDQPLNRIMKLCVLWFAPITVSYLFISICGNWQQTYMLAKAHNLNSVSEIFAFGLTRFWYWPTYGWLLVSMGTLPALSIATLFSNLKLGSKLKHALGLTLTVLTVLLCVFCWVDSRTNLLHQAMDITVRACGGIAAWSILAALLSWTTYFWLFNQLRIAATTKVLTD